MLDAKKFLSQFYQDDDEIVFAIIHESTVLESKFKHMIHTTAKLKDLDDRTLGKWTVYKGKARFFLKSKNKEGSAIYFVPNSGGTKDNDITRINAHYIDADFAKVYKKLETRRKANEEREKMLKTGEFRKIGIEMGKDNYQHLTAYRNTDVIARLKAEFLSKYEKELKDGCIVETYAGYHVYWLIEDGEVERFTPIQKALIAKFESDDKIHNAARLMRVPQFLHQKYEDSFEIKVIQYASKRFTQKELVLQFGLTVGDPKVQKGHRKEGFVVPINRFQKDSPTQTITIIVPKKRSDLKFRVLERINEKMTWTEFVRFARSKPFSFWVEDDDIDESRFCCHFHDDKHPSAGTFLAEDGATYMYKCHSCDVGYQTIEGLYMLQYGTKYRETLKRLAVLAGIKIEKSAFELEQLEKYEENRFWIYQKQEIFELMYPNVNRYVFKYNNRVKYLKFLNDWASLNIIDDKHAKEGHNLFFISYREMMRQIGVSSWESSTNAIHMLCLLGFIERVNIDEVPDDLRIRAEKERKALQETLKSQEKGKRIADYIRYVNFYIVPNWQDRARGIEAMASKMHEMKFSISKHMTKSGLTQLFGEEAANRVYADNRKISNTYKKVADKLQATIDADIQKQEYSILEQVIQTDVVIRENRKLIKVKTEYKEQVVRQNLANWGLEIQAVRSKAKKEAFSVPQRLINKQVHIVTRSTT